MISIFFPPDCNLTDLELSLLDVPPWEGADKFDNFFVCRIPEEAVFFSESVCVAKRFDPRWIGDF